MNAYDITALRFAVAGLILLPVVVRRVVDGAGWLGAAVLSLGAGAPYVLIAVGGLSFAPAGLGGVIIPSCMLTLSTIGGWLLLGDRPDRTRLIGLAIVIVGVVLVGWSSFATASGETWIGDLMFIAAGALWATYTIALRFFSANPLHATALDSVLSMIFYLPGYFLLGDAAVFVAPVSEILFQAVFQGVAVGILALLFYTRAVAYLGATRGAVFAALVPGLAVIAAFPVLGETPTLLEIFGLATVTGGMVLALGLVHVRLFR